MNNAEDNATVVTKEMRHILQYFDYAHLPERLQAISKPFHDLAYGLVSNGLTGPEMEVSLRKLLEAKDAAVRAALPTR